MPLSQEAMDRFWSKVDIRSPDECWPWTAGRSPEGYGRFKADNEDLRANRIACETVHGPVPAHLQVLHSCDNPPCCNPAHLSPGTQRRNMAERAERGRCPTTLRGRHPKAKVSAEDAAAIRDSDLPGVVLAARYGVAKSTITFIRKGPSAALIGRRLARRAEALAGI